MNYRSSFRLTLLQALLFTAGIFLSSMANAQNDIAFKGRVIMPDGGRDEITMMLKDSEGVKVVPVDGNAHYEFRIPLRGCISLTVIAPGFTTRTIDVATELSAPQGPVEYDIHMEPIARAVDR